MKYGKPWTNSINYSKLCDGTQATKKYWYRIQAGSANKVTTSLSSAEAQYWKEKFFEAYISSTSWKTVDGITATQKLSRVGPLKDENDAEVLDDDKKANLLFGTFLIE